MKEENKIIFLAEAVKMYVADEDLAKKHYIKIIWRLHKALKDGRIEAVKVSNRYIINKKSMESFVIEENKLFPDLLAERRGHGTYDRRKKIK